MMMHFGYSDGSGEYYIVIDTDKCNGCALCLQNCPQGALEIEDMLIDLEDQMVALVKEEHRKKLKYTCASCKPEMGLTPCISACKLQAIKCIWKMH
jgi:NAD-dependent dihydropyrimidine dehydrogenase PreA subunit